MSSQQKEKTTWEKVMALKPADTRHVGVANNLDRDEINTILGTLDFFGENLALPHFDLSVARYRIFDWLAMGVGGRINNQVACKVLVHSFLKSEGDIDKFIKDLRETDYQMDNSWEEVELQERN